MALVRVLLQERSEGPVAVAVVLGTAVGGTLDLCFMRPNRLRLGEVALAELPSIRTRLLGRLVCLGIIVFSEHG